MVEPSDGFRAYEPAGESYAVFCRLEHIVPWEIQGPLWQPGAGPPANPRTPRREAEDVRGTGLCSYCDAALIDTAVLLVRHRGEHRIGDGFCSAPHMAAWAKAGGRWQ
jgi:hypothetical protein